MIEQSSESPMKGYEGCYIDAARRIAEAFRLPTERLVGMGFAFPSEPGSPRQI